MAARINCHFTHAGNKYEAVILDMSLGGAFLSSKHLPPTGGTIEIEFKDPKIKDELKLDARVIRGSWVNSDHGKLGRFGVSFLKTSLSLIKLLSSLNK